MGSQLSLLHEIKQKELSGASEIDLLPPETKLKKVMLLVRFVSGCVRVYVSGITASFIETWRYDCAYQ